MKSFNFSIIKKWEIAILSSLSGILGINSLFFILRKGNYPDFNVEHIAPLIFYIVFLITTSFVLFTLHLLEKNIFDWKSFFKKLLLIYLPTEVIMFLGFTQDAHVHYIFNIATGAYLIIAGILLISLRKFSWRSDIGNYQSSMLTWIKAQGATVWMIIFLVMAANLFFGSLNLAKFGAVDEPLWTFDRIPKFWNSLTGRDFEHTRVSDKPGITVAIISGIGLINESNPAAYKSIYNKGGIDERPYDIEKLNFLFRLPIFLFTIIMLPLFYFLTQRLIGKNTALFAYILIGLSPLLIGMSTIINPDALLWIFAPLSLLSFLTYLKRRNPIYLYLASILLGLSLLTKYVANILYVFFLMLIFIEYIFHKKNYEDISIVKYLRESMLDYFTLVFTSLTVFYVLYPASWVEPVRLLKGTILSQAFESTWPIFASLIFAIFFDMAIFKSRFFARILEFFSRHKKFILKVTASLFLFFITITFINVYLGMRWYDFESIIASPKTAFQRSGLSGQFIANFFPLVFTLTPIAIASLLVATVTIITKKGSELNTRKTSLVFSLILFILIYYIGTTSSKVVAMNRYQIMIFPIAMILGGIGINILYLKLSHLKPVIQKSIFFIVFLLSLLPLYISKPFYISYSSNLLPLEYYTDIKDMGTGSYEAAQYINSLPDANKLTVWTDKKGVCPFLKAKCASGFSFESLLKKNIDYAIISSGRESRTINMVRPNSNRKYQIRFDLLYGQNTENVMFNLEIDGRPKNYVRVIKLNEEFFSL